MFQCSSASRKFGKHWTCTEPRTRTPRFSALLRAENSEKKSSRTCSATAQEFQCSSASRKFGKAVPCALFRDSVCVSVLFCEPKIRKSDWGHVVCWDYGKFQCSSASRKFGKSIARLDIQRTIEGFSALLRAENSENCVGRAHPSVRVPFQCSSASRKFGKPTTAAAAAARPAVSVLFCEPKIRKRCGATGRCTAGRRFSALLRAENSEKDIRGVIRSKVFLVSVLFCEPKIRKTRSRPGVRLSTEVLFQCSSASRKFGKDAACPPCSRSVHVSVLFCEPKIRKTPGRVTVSGGFRRFSALLRAENSENARRHARRCGRTRFQCSSASRKFGKSLISKTVNLLP